MSYTDQDFKPSEDERVDLIESAAEFLAAIIVQECPDGPLRDKAIIDCQSASMFAVKSLYN
jgi:hypothetical protein